MPLSKSQTQLHERALDLAEKYRRLESQLVTVLQEVDSSKLYKKLDQPSLFMYATRVLKMSEAVAYAFIAVARKTQEVPELKTAIELEVITVSKAAKLVAHITNENASRLIEFAKTHTAREIEAETARMNPVAPVVDKVKILSENQYQLTITVSKKGFEQIKRLESLEAQKQKRLNRGEAIELAVETHLHKYDPVEKAHRANKRRDASSNAENLEDGSLTIRTKDDESLVNRTTAHRPIDYESSDDRSSENGISGKGKSASRSKHFPKPQIETELFTCRVPTTKRESLTAEQRHAVFAKDQGKCTHRGADGRRCNSDRWVQVHHIVHVSLGGTNDPVNLTTLCSFHHDIVHQQSFPIEGQVSWLREPFAPYRMNS